MRIVQNACVVISLLAVSGSCANAADATAPGDAALPASQPASQPSPPPVATAPGSQPTAPVVFSDADNGKSASAPIGATITISLKANATTGYSWSLDKIEGDAVISAGDIQYTPDATRGPIGSGGTAIARFTAAKTGKATITLVYKRPWEKGTPPAKTFVVTIEVSAGK